MIRANLLLTGVALLSFNSAIAQEPSNYVALNYDSDDAWLCRSGREVDTCDIDLTTTGVNADGSVAIEP